MRIFSCPAAFPDGKTAINYSRQQHDYPAGRQGLADTEHMGKAADREAAQWSDAEKGHSENSHHPAAVVLVHLGLDQRITCLLYTSDAADERSSVDLGGRRIIKKKKRRIDSVQAQR